MNVLTQQEAVTGSDAVTALIASTVQNSVQRGRDRQSSHSVKGVLAPATLAGSPSGLGYRLVMRRSSCQRVTFKRTSNSPAVKSQNKHIAPANVGYPTWSL